MNTYPAPFRAISPERLIMTDDIRHLRTMQGAQNWEEIV